MRKVIENIPYPVLIVLTLVLLMAPFHPMPHVMEKLMMLREGELRRPIDIFDLIYHLAPLGVLLMKLMWDPRRSGRSAGQR